MFVSVTRLHLRSWRFYPRFILYTFLSTRQARRVPGFRAGALASDRHGGFWTLTVWDSEATMRAFRNEGAHRRAMRHLLEWCDEASFAHWTADGANLPSSNEAYRRLRDEGRVSKVLHPSRAHQASRTVGDGEPRIGISMRPR